MTKTSNKSNKERKWRIQLAEINRKLSCFVDIEYKNRSSFKRNPFFH